MRKGVSFYVADFNGVELSRVYGSMKAVSDDLGVSYSTLRRNLKEHGIYSCWGFRVYRAKFIRCEKKSTASQ